MYTKRLVSVCVFALLLFVCLPGLGASQLPTHTKSSTRLQKLKRLRQPEADWRQRTYARRTMHPESAIRAVTRSFIELQPMITSGAPARIGFLSAPQSPAGGDPSGAAAAADFNGDGNMDVAATVYNPDTGKVSISVALGNGDGTFQIPKLTASSTNDPYENILLVADVNGDGKRDVLLFCQYVTDPETWASEAKVEVFIGNGSGTFVAPVAYNTGAAYVVAASAVEKNGDQAPDLMAVSPDGRLITMLNNGNGTFQPPLSVLYPGILSSAVVADLNGDGKPDFAGFDDSTQSYQVYLAKNDGTFQQFQLPSADTNYACSIVAGDLSGDGKPELVISNCGYISNNVTTYKNNGDGTFGGGTSLWAGFYPQGLSLADVNGDNNNDVVALNEASGDVTVLLGNRDGTLLPPALCRDASCSEGGYAVGGLPWTAPAIADFNGDGKLDAIVADDQFSFVFLQGYGDGAFRAAMNYYGPRPADDSWPNSISLAQGDLNADNYPDIVVASSGSANAGLTVFLNDNNGGLRPGATIGTGDFQYVAIGHFHGNFGADVAATSTSTDAPHSVQVFLNNGDGTFQAGRTYPVDLDDPQSRPQGIVAADLNGDSKDDLAVIDLNGSVSILLNDAQSGFRPPVKYPLPGGGYQLAVEDLNKDGKLDIVAADFYQDSVDFLRGHGDGTFDAAQSIAVGTSPDGIAVADLNGDHTPDIAVAHWDDNSIAVLMGKGDGTFDLPVYYPASLQGSSGEGPNAAEIRIADVDGDSSPDLIWENSAYGTVAVLYGDGQGGFAGPVEFPVASNPYGLVVADMNLDEAPDVVTSNHDMLGATVLMNGGGVAIQAAANPNPAQLGQTITLTATVSGTVRGVTAIPTGTVEFVLGSTTVGTAALFNGTASVDASSTALGDHTAIARYSGDKLFRPKSSSITFSVSKPATTTSITSSVNPTMEGDPVTFTAIVTTGSGLSTGTIVFRDGAATLGIPVTLDNNGKATLTTSTLPVGTHSITAVYAGDTNHEGSTSEALSQVVKGQLAATTTTLTSSSNPSVTGRSVTFTATVVSSKAGTITGAVAFTDGATVLGTGTLDASGKASFSAASLAASTHSITAVYGGDSGYASSTSASLAQIVLASAPDYSLSADPTTLNIKAGQSGSTTITATADAYFNGTVSFSCGALPTGVHCQFTPSSLTPTSGHPATTTLAVTTTAQTAAAAIPASPISGNQALIFLASLCGTGVFGTVLLGDISNRRRRYTMLLVGLVLLAALLGSVACGGGGSQAPSPSPTNPNATPIGQLTVPVSATATAGSTGGNTSAHPLTLTINVSK